MRQLNTVPIRILDAPGLIDDFYSNPLAWSVLNTLGVGLGDALFVRDGNTGEDATMLGTYPAGTSISSVEFSKDGSLLAAGFGTGQVELWDVKSGQKVGTMSGHQGKVGTLSWHGHIVSSGCGDGSIWHHDIRIPRHKVMELRGHAGQVCGLEWREDGALLASGGNDNVFNIWDGRVPERAVNEDVARGTTKWVKTNHTAAVRAIAWCPWQPTLLASGGGMNDATINLWNGTTGTLLHTRKTHSQVTNIVWGQQKELLSTHGFPKSSIVVHAYPSMEPNTEIRDPHKTRVLYCAMGPTGEVVATGAEDEEIKFWKIWDLENSLVTGRSSRWGESHFSAWTI